MERTCRECGETKPIEKFKKVASCRYGHGHICYKCFRKKWDNTEKGKERRKRRNKKRNELRKLGIIKRPKASREQNRIRALKYRRKNIIKMQNKANNETKSLTNRYISSLINQASGLPYKIIKEHPELIDSWRQQIKLKRLIKSQKNGESIKTG